MITIVPNFLDQKAFPRSKFPAGYIFNFFQKKIVTSDAMNSRLLFDQIKNFSNLGV